MTVLSEDVKLDHYAIQSLWRVAEQEFKASRSRMLIALALALLAGRFYGIDSHQSWVPSFLLVSAYCALLVFLAQPITRYYDATRALMHIALLGANTLRYAGEVISQESSDRVERGRVAWMYDHLSQLAGEMSGEDFATYVMLMRNTWRHDRELSVFPTDPNVYKERSLFEATCEVEKAARRVATLQSALR